MAPRSAGETGAAVLADAGPSIGRGPAIRTVLFAMSETSRVVVAFVPLVGWLIALYFMVQPGETAENRYGPDPKEVSAEAML